MDAADAMQVMDAVGAMAEAYPTAFYLGFLLAPFVQEDAAVIGAAAASAMGMGETELLFATIVAGLTASDLWKYWAGRLAHTHAWARRFAEKPAVAGARDRVVNRLGLTLVWIRFVPGTRIPFYVASGFFRAPFAKYALFIVLSSAIYAGVAFALLHVFGEAAGERAHMLTPYLALGLAATAILAQIALARRRAARRVG